MSASRLTPPPPPAAGEPRRPLGALGRLANDVRYGLRLALRNPLFAAAVVGLLALGIGATTAMLSVFKQVVLAPLPYPDAERLFMVWETEPHYDRVPVSGPNFLDWQAESRAFAALAAVQLHSYNLSAEGQPERVSGALVTSALFQALGTGPALGRAFSTAEDRPGAAPVAVISHSLWQRRFGASRQVLGETLTLDGVPHTVVGVLPPGLELLTPWSLGDSPEIWTPLPLTSSIEKRDAHSFLVFGRLAPGVPAARAGEEMKAIAARLEEAYPETNHGHGARLVPLQRQLLGPTTAHLRLLLGAATFVLLIVCANVGGLLLARATTREAELAVRTSLGAGRRRLLAQLVTENLPLAVAGGAGGALVAAWLVDALRVLAPHLLAHGRATHLDAWSLLTVSALALLTSVLCGLVPALAVSRREIAGFLGKAGSGSPAARRGARVHRWLVVAQLALTLTLANGAALMVASYLRLQRTEPGFDPRGLVTVQLSLSGPRYQGVEPVVQLYQGVLPRLRSLPGVLGAAATTKLPLTGGTNGSVVIEGREGDWGDEIGPLVERSFVTPGYFETMGIRRLAGRALTAADQASEAPVAVINETLARVAWPEADPIGKRFALDPEVGWITVVGVVGDVRQHGLERPPIPEYYFPLAAAPAYWAGWTPQAARSYVVLRSAGPLEPLVRGIEEAVWSHDPEQPVAGLLAMEEIMSSLALRRRFNTLLVALFAGVGLLLMAAGVFGALSTFVSRHRREIGVRMALGARPEQVLRLVFGYVARLVGAGLALGLVAGLASGALMASQLYGVSPVDPGVLVGGAALVLMVGLLAGLIPARRAVEVDPMTTLRSDT